MGQQISSLGPGESIVRYGGTAPGYYVENGIVLALATPVLFVGFTLVRVGFDRLSAFSSGVTGVPSTPSVLSTLLAYLPVLVVVMLLAGFVYLVLRARAVKYVLTDRRLMTSYGLFTHTVVTAPLEQLQDVRFHQPFLGRLLGYGFVMAQTAGTYGQVNLRYVAKPGEWVAAIDSVARALRAPQQGSVYESVGQGYSDSLLPGPDLLRP